MIELAMLLWLAETPTSAPHPLTVYLDFDGGPVQQGELSSEGQAPCVRSEFEYPYWGTSDERATVLEESRRIVEAYDVTVTDREPPPQLPYTRVMIGGKKGAFGLDAQHNGFTCSVDCGDTWWRDMVLVFPESMEPKAVARTAVHEVGHALGLDHVEGHEDLMARDPVDAAEFLSDCLPLVGDSKCFAEHETFCSPGRQSSHQELVALLGPARNDTEPPDASILSPVDGLRVTPGTELLVEAEVVDDRPGVGWKLVVPEEDFERIAVEGEREILLILPEGAFTLRIEAVDHGGNTASDEVFVVARPPWPEPTATCTCKRHSSRWSSTITWLPLVLLLFRRGPRLDFGGLKAPHA